MKHRNTPFTQNSYLFLYGNLEESKKVVVILRASQPSVTSLRSRAPSPPPFPQPKTPLVFSCLFFIISKHSSTDFLLIKPKPKPKQTVSFYRIRTLFDHRRNENRASYGDRIVFSAPRTTHKQTDCGEREREREGGCLCPTFPPPNRNAALAGRSFAASSGSPRPFSSFPLSLTIFQFFICFFPLKLSFFNIYKKKFVYPIIELSNILIIELPHFPLVW